MISSLARSARSVSLTPSHTHIHTRAFARSAVLQKMKVVPVPVRDDNYAYIVLDDANKTAAAVDPWDVPKVQAKADELGVKLVAALTTHHHHDHAGGNQKFAEAYPDVPIYGGSQQVSAVTKIVKDKDEFTIGDGLQVRCLHTPCHTQDSICYHITSSSGDHAGAVFTGDTLFLAGCGRFFEGTGDEMHRALSYLGTLPDQTLVYNGHEYTKSSVKFALSVDPENAPLQALEKRCESEPQLAGRTSIGEEKQWNVFMRLDSEPVLKATGLSSSSGDGAIMDKLREMKNGFRG